MPTRRTVLLAGVATAAAAATAAVGFSFLEQPAVPDAMDQVLDKALSADERWAAVARHLRARFWYLDLPDTTLDAFIVAAKQHYRLPSSKKRLDRLRKKFLMCTDFFLKDADESRPLSFVAWFDPYVTPCWNPLARRPTAE